MNTKLYTPFPKFDFIAIFWLSRVFTILEADYMLENFYLSHFHIKSHKSERLQTVFKINININKILSPEKKNA